MNEAGLIENGSMPKFAYCPTGSIPQLGDFIFFDWQVDGISEHVGIVERIEGNIVYTIKGNSINDECRQRNYEINSRYIYGYETTKTE